MVDNTCITVTDVTISVGKDDPNPKKGQTIDFDVKLTKAPADKDNLWTLSINPKSEADGTPNTKKIHYTFSQSDMSQIVSVIVSIWQDQP